MFCLPTSTARHRDYDSKAQILTNCIPRQELPILSTCAALWCGYSSRDIIINRCLPQLWKKEFSRSWMIQLLIVVSRKQPKFYGPFCPEPFYGYFFEIGQSGSKGFWFPRNSINYNYFSGMDTDLRLPSGEQPSKEDNECGMNSMFHGGDMKLHNGHLEVGNSSNIITVVRNEMSAEDGENGKLVGAGTGEEHRDVRNLEPLPGMEFESNQEAYSFYQEYARSMGFSTAIQNSRRSKASSEFIDTKFACSRYGKKRDYEKSADHPRLRKSKRDQKNGGRRSGGKTDCKASMHVKRRPDGKWIIHNLVIEHNHELLPAQAISEQTRQIYAALTRQFAARTNEEQGLSSLPSQYLLKRWTKVAKNRSFLGEESKMVDSRVQRYNSLCYRAMKLSEEGSISQDSYNIAIHALEEAFGKCLSLNTSSKYLPENVTSPANGLISMEDDNQSKSMNKANKKRSLAKKKKVSSEQEVMAAVGAPDGLQQMEKLTPRPVQMDAYFGAQQTVPGMVQLNLMDSHRDNYYGSQQNIHGLAQLSSLAPTQGGYYNAQQSISGLGEMDFFRTSGAFTYGIRDDPNPNVRAAQLHNDASRHHGSEARMCL
ncbi:hypothetical protein ACFE04_012358 [Oxalis oulophora]